MKRQPALRLDAELMVDTGGKPRHPGLRSGDGGRRQLLFRAGDLYLDLSLHRRPGSSDVALIGQLLDAGTASRNLADLPIELDCESGAGARTRSNGLGEFLLTRVPAGVATLAVTIDRWTNVRVPLPAADGDAGGGR